MKKLNSKNLEQASGGSVLSKFRTGRDKLYDGIGAVVGKVAHVATLPLQFVTKKIASVVGNKMVSDFKKGQAQYDMDRKMGIR